MSDTDKVFFNHLLPHIEEYQSKGVPPIQLERRWQTEFRAALARLEAIYAYLDKKAIGYDSHMAPFNRANYTDQETLGRYRFGELNWMAAYIVLVMCGFTVRPYLSCPDQMPNFKKIQVLDINGRWVSIYIAGSKYPDDKNVMSKEAYRALFYQVNGLCGKSDKPVRGQKDDAMIARAKRILRAGSAPDLETVQAGDNIGRIIEPCSIWDPGILTMPHEQDHYGMNCKPSWWDRDLQRLIEPVGWQTKGEILGWHPPYGISYGHQLVDVVIFTTWENRTNFVLLGGMIYAEAVQIAPTVTMDYTKGQELQPGQEPVPGKPTDRAIMPWAAKCLRPIGEIFSWFKGFDQAVAKGLLIR